jgi:long-subunit acyl-CoA synthetase (AMP-forming)
MPEWGMTYFGILKAGATAIPIDPASSVEEIVNFAKAGEASAIVLSPKLAGENPTCRQTCRSRYRHEGLDLRRGLRDAGRDRGSETAGTACRRRFSAMPSLR